MMVKKLLSITSRKRLWPNMPKIDSMTRTKTTFQI